MTDTFDITAAPGAVAWTILVLLVPRVYRPSLIKPLAGWTNRFGAILLYAADGDFLREAARRDNHNDVLAAESISEPRKNG